MPDDTKKPAASDLSAAPCSLTINPSDPEVIAICSMVCFQCGSIAGRLRMGGHEIDKKAEDEQAKVILWLLGIYKTHGIEWRAKADEALRAMKPEVENRENTHCELSEPLS